MHIVQWIGPAVEPMLELPDKATRAGRVLGFNAEGRPQALSVITTVTVNSVFGRTGNIVPLAGDYTASQVTNDGDAAGATVGEALTALDGGKAPVDHDHGGVYEPAFEKNTAFNRDFGSGPGEVAEGDHAHLSADPGNQLSAFKVWSGSKADFDKVDVKDANTLYMVI